MPAAYLKRFCLTCFAVLMVCVGAGKPDKDEAYRYRKSGEKYYDLKPLFDWWKPQVAELFTKNPIPEWEKLPMATVVQVFDDGLLIRLGTSSRNIFVKHCPWRKTAVDGDYFSLTITRIGNYEYRSVLGAKITVELWDFGIPYDPKAKGPDGKAKLLPTE